MEPCYPWPTPIRRTGPSVPWTKPLKKINKQRADLGAYQNRLEHAIRGIDVGAENLQAAESRIRDTDMAKEMVSYTRDRILSQSGTAMLAQANQKSNSVLQLLQ